MTTKPLPTTLDEAVGVSLAMLDDKALDEVAGIPFSNLFNLHFGLGQWIRDHLDLWQPDSVLLRAIQAQNPRIHPNDASAIIIEDLWHRLQEFRPKIH